MITIYKYELKIKDSQLVELPWMSNILSVQFQNGTLCLWAEVDTTTAKIQRTILIFGTGNPIEDKDDRVFLGTAQHNGFVWHVFEKI